MSFRIRLLFFLDVIYNSYSVFIEVAIIVTLLSSILLCSVPSAAPQNVRGQNTSSTSILVAWDEVPVNEQRGNIRYYTVIYMETQGGAEMSKRVDSSTLSVELTGLKRYAKYSIQVSAATVKGDGPASVPVTVSTKQGSE